jgi:rsbT co-antagonist protein RsbR
VLLLGLMVFCVLSAVLARRGRVTTAALVLIGAVLVVLIVTPLASEKVAFTPFFFIIPVLLGLITVQTSRIWLVTLMTLGSIGALAILARNLPPTILNDNSVYILSSMLIMIVTAVGFVGARTTQRAISASAYAQRQTEQIAFALQREKDTLTERVQERTAELAQALDEARLLADTQAQLLRENVQQRDVIRNLSVPVLPLDHGLLVIPVIGALDRERLDDLRRQALSGIETYAVERVLLDITGVPVLDREVAESLLGTVHAARLLGAEVTLVGIRPEVADALVSLNLDTRSIQSYSSLQMALQSTRLASAHA